MPVISAGIVTKGGRIVLSRQYTDITRIRIEGLLSAFPKLLASSSKQQYTVVETESVRYVYQPIEDLFLVVITTKSSNIVEDLQTLRLMGRLIPDHCGTSDITEEDITNNAFDILFALDEVVTCGYRENVTLEQVMSILEMHSHEEEMAQEDKKKAERDAMQHAKKKAKELAAQRREKQMSGVGGGGGGVSSNFPAQFDEPSSSTPSAPPPRSGFSDVAEDLTPARKNTGGGGGGMMLGKQKKADASSKVMAESGAAHVPSAPTAGADRNAGSASPQPTEPFNIKIVEHCSVTMNRDGGVTAMDVHGEMIVQAVDPALPAVKIVLAPYVDAFTFKSHPAINKQLLTSDKVLVSKEGKPYPNQQSLGILKWRCSQEGPKVKAPISVNVWPSDSSFTLEYCLENPEISLQNVIISVPIGSAFPEVDSVSSGNYTHDAEQGYIHWNIPSIDKGVNDDGTMEVQLDKNAGPDFFYPTEVQFASPNLTMAKIQPVSVTNLETGEPLQHSCNIRFKSENYTVQ